MVGPRSRCPGKNKKSLTTIPRLSRYQFSVSRYFVVCTTRWPRRCTRAGTRAGRWLALMRCASSPTLNVWGCWPGSSGSSCMPATTRTGHPAGVDQVDRQSAEGLRQRPRANAGFVGQPQHVGLVAGPKGDAAESRARPPPHDHARCARVGAAQLELVRTRAVPSENRRPARTPRSASGRASRTPATRCRRP